MDAKEDPLRLIQAALYTSKLCLPSVAHSPLCLSQQLFYDPANVCKTETLYYGDYRAWLRSHPAYRRWVGFTAVRFNRLVLSYWVAKSGICFGGPC